MHPDHNYREALNKKFATISSVLLFLAFLPMAMIGMVGSVVPGLWNVRIFVRNITICMLATILFDRGFAEIVFSCYLPEFTHATTEL